MDPPHYGFCFGVLTTQSLARLLADSYSPQAVLLQGFKYRVTVVSKWQHPSPRLPPAESIKYCSSYYYVCLGLHGSISLWQPGESPVPVLRLQACMQHPTQLFLIFGEKKKQPTSRKDYPKTNAKSSASACPAAGSSARAAVAGERWLFFRGGCPFCTRAPSFLNEQQEAHSRFIVIYYNVRA